MSTAVELDFSRLAFIETLKDNALGAVRKAEERVHETGEQVRAKVRRLDELAAILPRDRYDAQTKNEDVVQLKEKLEKYRADFRAAIAVRDAAYERFNASGNLYESCKKFAEGAR